MFNKSETLGKVLSTIGTAVIFWNWAKRFGGAASTPANAALFGKKPEVAADEAVQGKLATITIWVDASWGFRNQGVLGTGGHRRREGQVAAIAPHGFDHKGAIVR